MGFWRTVIGSVITASIMGVASAQPLVQERYGYRVLVDKVHDGDTFTIRGDGWSPFPNLSWSIRVRGIDTPELSSKCKAEHELALRARDTADALIMQSGRYVWLQQVGHDKYGGRFDATVVLANGQSLGDILVNQGYAHSYDGGKKEPWCDSHHHLIKPVVEVNSYPSVVAVVLRVLGPLCLPLSGSWLETLM